MANQVNLTMDGSVAVVRVDNPPVNALSHAVRAGLQGSFRAALSRAETKAVVICCAGRSFFAGADIREFGKPPLAPFLPDLITEIEAAQVPVIAAMHGNVLGGGLEAALGAHYRIAVKGTRLGLPEVSLGLLPGAGGTQRLPRLIPAADAARMITGGKPVSADAALSMGLIDRVADGTDARAEGIAFARELIAAGKEPRPAGSLLCNILEPAELEGVRAKVARAARGAIAPIACLDAVEAAMSLPFEGGLKKERALFQELMASDQSTALIHAFFAERQVGKLPEIEGVDPRAINRMGVVGGGTMGAGIAVSALLSGLDVTLAERDEVAADRAADSVGRMLESAVKRGKLAAPQRDAILAQAFRTTTRYEDFAQADLVIEAVFESMDVKKDVFTRLDEVCKPGAILASNTSYLDLNRIAAMTSRLQDVIGLHFFSPAHVMRLLEVVVGKDTAPDAVASGFALAKRLKKVAVRAGVCDGFIGNRILSHYGKAVYGMVLAGASPYAVDKALTGFGLAMGPFAVGDLAGLDIGWANRKRLAAERDPRETYPEFADRLCELGRFGRKTGRGFYIYEEGAGGPKPDPEVEDIIAAERTAKGITPRAISEDEIISRYMAAMVNEAARVVGDGIAQRPLDVDVTLLNGYGFPRWRGGPMHYADTIGLDRILQDICRYHEEDPILWQPAPLLERLAAEGRSFGSLNT
ncbi:enoyl-CoA hydratase/isomerase family protein [Leisingera sp. HS039]|uniref:3-hydroxyacyl-CoA dehydrogenase NAD-binding domain-containing protein n=1 Tax=unclassified Leisingera TaxID=2614906 RepID=UPI001070B1BC|nr:MULTISPECIES: 3-hydroxyacyl-CoA dehydrogenase NAD-binding domain-containing protein [unclassified Leisingera]MBQ4827210.1 enoyl-CoA hydratase/isomerase family protein [Leisingera sp. HS039]QBR37253.1 3-hydroxyacyl-CoA dehydrogenase [Leisingera sp. NJS201]